MTRAEERNFYALLAEAYGRLALLQNDAGRDTTAAARLHTGHLSTAPACSLATEAQEVQKP